MFLDMFLKVAGAAAIAALLFVVYLVRHVLSKPQGTERMAFLSREVQKGAAAFLKREYTWVSGLLLPSLFFRADRCYQACP